jgi:phosphoesterase RecJ-like protein
MLKQTAQLLKTKIGEYKNIIIAKHVAPDWDALGSAEGLRNIIIDNYEDKNVFVVGSSVESTDLIDDDKLSDEIISSALLITVDTANIERVNFPIEKIKMAKETFRIDHHINDSPYTDFEYIFQDSISCTQVITLWAHDMELKISKTAAEFLYRGLLTDSNRFAFRNTSVDTFEAAKILLQSGVSVADITQEIFQRSLAQAQWCNEAFTRIKIDHETKFAYITADYNDLRKFNLTSDEFKAALGTMSSIKEINVWALIYKIDEESDIKISLRSKKININKLAIQYGGGGHVLASGGYLKSWDELDDFLVVAKNYLKGEIK